MICGGSNVSDAGNDPSPNISTQTPASDQCARLVLTEEGIRTGWSVETMPQPRVMPELIILPDERILIVNGASTGVAGEGNVSKFTTTPVHLLTVPQHYSLSKTVSGKAMLITLHQLQSSMILVLLQDIDSLRKGYRRLLYPECIIPLQA